MTKLMTCNAPYGIPSLKKDEWLKLSLPYHVYAIEGITVPQDRGPGAGKVYCHAARSILSHGGNPAESQILSIGL